MPDMYSLGIDGQNRIPIPGGRTHARGAALGACLYVDEREAFRSLKVEQIINPKPEGKAPLEEVYGNWKTELRLSKDFANNLC